MKAPGRRTQTRPRRKRNSASSQYGTGSTRNWQMAGHFCWATNLRAADFLLTMLTRWSRNMTRTALEWPHLKAYVERMRAMPSYCDTHARENLYGLDLVLVCVVSITAFTRIADGAIRMRHGRRYCLLKARRVPACAYRISREARAQMSCAASRTRARSSCAPARVVRSRSS